MRVSKLTSYEEFFEFHVLILSNNYNEHICFLMPIEIFKCLLNKIDKLLF